MNKTINNLLSSILISIIFLSLCPITEWPDAVEHIQRSSNNIYFYPYEKYSDIENSISKITNNTNFKYFSDTCLYSYKEKIIDLFIIINFKRCLIIFLMILLIYYQAYKKAYFIPLTPPLIYSLCSPSQEALAIFFTVLSLIFIKKRLIYLFLLLISVSLDRSMVISALSILLMGDNRFILFIKNRYTKFLLIFFLSFLFTNFFKFRDFIFWGPEYYNIGILGITTWDILYAQKSGEWNLYSLFASLSGLYGALSIRPYPHFIYYVLIISFFLFGFKKSNQKNKIIFLINLQIAFLLLWIFPSLGQARYFPVLIILFWRNIYLGFREYKYIPFDSLAIIATFIGFYNIYYSCS